MCGIVAVLSQRPSALVSAYLLEGIQMLQNRGYDSCGGVLLSEEHYWLWKGASTVEATALERLDANVPDERMAWTAGCFQTRWATHGAKTDANAHPHSDRTGRFHVVHNGIITNYAVHKARLLQKGYEFRSETDTEVVVHMVSDCVRSKAEPVNMLEVWREVIGHLEGTWSLVMCDLEHPSWLYVAKHGSPLLLSYSEDGTMLGVASEAHGIRFKTLQYQEVQDGAVFIVDQNLRVLHEGMHIPVTALPASSASVVPLPTQPDPYRFWTELEIHQQVDTLRDALNRGGRLFVGEDGVAWSVKLGGLDRRRAQFQTVRHMVLVGCGTSLYAAQFAARVFRAITPMATVQVFDASEFAPVDVRQLEAEEVVVVLVSQSGETKDCQRVLAWAKERSFLTVGVVNAVGSWLARQTDCGIYLNAGREVGVASTKSFTSQCVVLTLLALWMCQGSTQWSRLAEWCPRVYNIAEVFSRNMVALEAAAQSLVAPVSRQRSVFVLGRGYAHAIALEGALKLKELTCKNVEGYAGGALKHGPFAVLGADATVFLHCWEGPDRDYMLSAAEQVSSREAQVVLVHNTSSPKDEAALQQRFPRATLVAVSASDEWSASLVSVVLYQYLAFYLARSCGLNPDQPRHLAKVVTVDG